MKEMCAILSLFSAGDKIREKRTALELYMWMDVISFPPLIFTSLYLIIFFVLILVKIQLFF